LPRPAPSRSIPHRPGRRSTPLRRTHLATRAYPATVLVADDDPELRDLVAGKLDRAGFSVLLAADGGAALTAIHRRRPDLVVLDHVLPDRSGLEICRQLRGDPGTATLPVIMLIPHPVDDLAAADSYLIKPFCPGELVGHVAELLVRVC
jgi:DNA-binding response OmpR family regulator